MTTITLLHPGAMGSAVGAQARAAGARVLWVTAGRSAASVERANRDGLEPVEQLADALSQSDIVLTICPPEFAESVSESVAAQGFRGIYVDSNAVSPQRMSRIAQGHDSGVAVVDGAIIGSPPRGNIRPRLYLAGDPDVTRVVAACFADTLVITHELAKPVGGASALKMAYGGYQKAARALAATSQALAHAHGVTDELLAEGRKLTGSILGETDHLAGAAAKAWRWAPEMEEVADAMRAVHLPPEFAMAAAATMRHWDGDKDDDAISVSDVIAHLRTDRSA